MSDDEQYREALGYYTRGRDENHPLSPDILHEEGAVYRADFDRFLARVRRDAAREALDGLARDVRDDWHRSHHWVTQPIEEYRDTHYPEETP